MCTIEFCQYAHTLTIIIIINVHAHTETSPLLCYLLITTTMSTVYTTLDYECRHENKGSGLILVPRKCGVYE
jgi:hypothetical protein